MLLGEVIGPAVCSITVEPLKRKNLSWQDQTHPTDAAIIVIIDDPESL